MRYASFKRPDGMPAIGRADGDAVVELKIPDAGKGGLKAALAAGALDGLEEGERYALADVTLLPPIPDPGKILCVGLNYANHIEETGHKRRDYPAIFTRFADTLVASGQPLVKPDDSDLFDYEGELAVIIGKPGFRIKSVEAPDHIAGYSCFNDGSVRDYQTHNSQFTPGKNFPGTGGFGPFLVTPDEAGALEEQRLTTRLNGDVVQDQSLADMIWSVAELIEYISSFTPLSPGDVIATGTPGGVGFRRDPPLFMKPGDVVEVSIGGVGTLSNTVA